MVPASKFIEAVCSCVGTPVAHMGREPGIRLDCVGVPIAALASCGEHVDVQPYSVVPSEKELKEQLQLFAVRVSDGPIAGDLLATFWLGKIRHVMVAVGGGEVVYARSRRGGGIVVREKMRRSHEVAEIWRLKGVF